MLTALIDADILVYRVGYTTEDVDEGIAFSRIRELIDTIRKEVKYDEAINFLTSTDKSNFRFSIAKTLPYKGNRKQPKPLHYDALRDYLIRKYDTVVISGQEADDAIGIYQCNSDEDTTIIVSIDKDLDMIPGWHYNFVKKERYKVDLDQALRNFYMQILIGDISDNISGARGVGKVRAKKYIDACQNEEEMWATCEKYYEGDTERLLENAQLLWIRREEGELWGTTKRCLE